MVIQDTQELAKETRKNLKKETSRKECYDVCIYIYIICPLL